MLDTLIAIQVDKVLFTQLVRILELIENFLSEFKIIFLIIFDDHLFAEHLL